MSPKTPQKNQKHITPITMAMTAPATTSLIKWTPPTTLITARQTPSTNKNTPTGTEIWKNVIATMKIEKTCLLGKLFPFVSLCKAGVNP